MGQGVRDALDGMLVQLERPRQRCNGAMDVCVLGGVAASGVMFCVGFSAVGRKTENSGFEVSDPGPS